MRALRIAGIFSLAVAASIAVVVSYPVVIALRSKEPTQ